MNIYMQRWTLFRLYFLFFDADNYSFKENYKKKCKNYYISINNICVFNGSCFDKNCQKCSRKNCGCLKCKEDKGLSNKGQCYETDFFDKNYEFCCSKDEYSSCFQCKEDKLLDKGFYKGPIHLLVITIVIIIKRKMIILSLITLMKIVKNMWSCKICLNEFKCSECKDNYNLSELTLIFSKEKKFKICDNSCGLY